MALFSDYVILDLARHASQPVTGQSSSSQWVWPGSACTASLVTLYPASQVRSVTYARWVVAWNPNSNANGSSVRLVNCTDGPSNLNQMAIFTRANALTPFDDTVDITSTMQAIWKYFAGLPSNFHLGHQTIGDGANAPLIYSSSIELGLV